MPTKHDIIAAKLAVLSGFAKQEKVDQCLKALQASGDARLALTHVMLKNGFVNSSQYRLLNIATRYELQREEDYGLARFLVRNKWVTERDMKDLLKEQDPLHREGKEFPRISELLVDGGVLSEARIAKAKKMMGGLARAGREIAASGFRAARVPTPKVLPKGQTIRSENLFFHSCRVKIRKQQVRRPDGQMRKVYTLAVSGQLDAHSLKDFDKYVESLISGGRSNLIFNLSKVTYLSSACIGVIASAAKRAKDAWGEVKLAEVPEDILKIIELTGFKKFMQICDSEIEAIDAFGKPRPG